MVEVDSDRVQTLIVNNCEQLWLQIIVINVTPCRDILKYPDWVHQLGYINHFDFWVPHKLNEKNPLDYISACSSVLKCNKNVPFLKQIVMGDDKWILYNRVEWKRLWGKRNELAPTTPKPDLQSKKVMCIWWDWKAVLY